MNSELFNTIVIIWLIIGIIIFPVLLNVKVPYGRHVNRRWGALINNKLGWIIMELPALLLFVIFFFLSGNKHNFIVWIFFGFWAYHYFYRSIIYPLRTKTSNKKIPLMIVYMAIFFNSINGYINGYYFGEIQPVYDASWLTDMRFISGSILFIAGMIINRISDRTLLKLRKPGETEYKIPYGGLFKYISCPNHFGEIIEWVGFAVLTWNLPALAFVVWTVANVMPRSLDHHKWYKNNFENYPENRKAIIPFIL